MEGNAVTETKGHEDSYFQKQQVPDNIPRCFKIRRGMTIYGTMEPLWSINYRCHIMVIQFIIYFPTKIISTMNE